MRKVVSKDEVDKLLMGIEGGYSAENETTLLLDTIPKFDAVTGLLNKKAFEKKLQSELERAKEASQNLSLVFLDIDLLSKINSDFGNEAGEAVWKIVFKTVTEITGEKAVLARFRFEELAILFVDKEREQAFFLAEQIRIALDKEHLIELPKQKAKIAITLSGGVAAYPTDGKYQSEIIRKTYQAQNRAKKSGGNKIYIAQEEKMATKSAHYTLTQLELLAKLSKKDNTSEAVLLREALDDLLFKYKV